MTREELRAEAVRMTRLGYSLAEAAAILSTPDRIYTKNHVRGWIRTERNREIAALAPKDRKGK